MNKSVVILITLFCLLVLGGGVYLATRKPASNPAIDQFAKCLTDKGAIMYGAYWCPHCQSQKKLFGDSFQYVKYVECTVDIQLCQDNKIDGYPTWVFVDGSRQGGEMTFQDLSFKTSCPVPN